MSTMLSEYPGEIVLWCAFALFLGGFVKGVVGVGLPIISVPLMSFVLPAYVAAALIVLPVFPANVVQLQAGGTLLEKIRRFWPVSLGIAVGTVTSAPFIIAADARTLQFIVACIVMLYALQRLSKREFSIQPVYEKPIGLGAGLFAGGIGGITMLIGPLVVVYMAALKLERDVFVGSIAFVYLVTTFSIAMTLAAFNQLNAPLLMASVLACIPAIAGVVSGARCRKYVSQRNFDRLLTAMIVAIALSMFYRALSHESR